MTPKSPTPGSDWLASVAAENQQRDDELERLRAENEALCARIAELEREREDVSPVPSAWPPVHMPIYDFRATSEERAGE